MRKSVSMNNLSQYHQPNNTNDLKIINNNYKTTAETSAAATATATGYGSADDVVHRPSAPGRDRKRGVPWTEEEHKLFLLGLQNVGKGEWRGISRNFLNVGKGEWRGISRNFVKSRTPTQVASHAQKYFLRNTNINKRRRRSSLFDITTHSVSAIPMEHDPGFCGEVNNATLGSVPAAAATTDVKDDPTLSLNLSLSFDHHNQLSSTHSLYPNLSNGDGMISVV